MPKFMSSHTMPARALKREQADQLAQAAQNDPIVKPYPSFLNLSEGKIFCVMEAPMPRLHRMVQENEDALRLRCAGRSGGRLRRGQGRVTGWPIHPIGCQVRTRYKRRCPSART